MSDLSVILEGVMLICFGASWPIAIIKTLRTKNPIGKSVIFLFLVLIGYMAGVANKIFSKFDNVFYLYVLNSCMVAVDLVLTAYYLRKNRLKAINATSATEQ